MIKIQFCEVDDIDQWMQLIYTVKDDFPGLETKEAFIEHKKTVLTFIDKKAAICAKMDHMIVAGLLFSKETHTLSFLAVHENYRRQHIGDKMISMMLQSINDQEDIIVTTYRKEALEGKAARAFYKHLGFIEGKLTEEFGSPVQEFILKRKK